MHTFNKGAIFHHEGHHTAMAAAHLTSQKSDRVTNRAKVEQGRTCSWQVSHS